MKIAVLPGDGIGPEIVKEAVKVLNVLGEKFELEEAPVGGAGYEAKGHPLPDSTLALAKEADAILFGAVGDWKYDSLERALRPEQAILGLRKHLHLFANFRPAICYPQLTGASSLKEEIVSGLDILIVRELNGDIYFGAPRGVRSSPDGLFEGAKEGFDTMRYSEPEVRRIAHVAFQAAQKRQKRLTSVDKANVLETSQFWRDVMIDVSKEYADVELSHMYVDNAAMQLVKAPKAFDVVVTGNMFGDILSDEAAMLTVDRHAAVGLARQEQQGLVRAVARFGTGYRRQRRSQSAGHDPVGGDDAALFAEQGGAGGSHRKRGKEGAGARFPHRRHSHAGLQAGRHRRHGRCGGRGAVRQ